MLTDHWPRFGLTVQTSRLELRLSWDDEDLERQRSADRLTVFRDEEPFIVTLRVPDFPVRPHAG